MSILAVASVSKESRTTLWFLYGCATMGFSLLTLILSTSVIHAVHEVMEGLEQLHFLAWAYLGVSIFNICCVVIHYCSYTSKNTYVTCFNILIECILAYSSATLGIGYFYDAIYICIHPTEHYPLLNTLYYTGGVIGLVFYASQKSPPKSTPPESDFYEACKSYRNLETCALLMVFLFPTYMLGLVGMGVRLHMQVKESNLDVKIKVNERSRLLINDR